MINKMKFNPLIMTFFLYKIQMIHKKWLKIKIITKIKLKKI